MKTRFLFLIVTLFTVGCAPTQNAPINTPAPNLPATRTPFPTATEAPRPTRIPQDTPTPTITPTLVPSGVFALLWYPPLVMDFDTSAWEDKTCYACANSIILLSSNTLQATTLATCRISIQGPTDINGTSQIEHITLGNLSYQVISWGESATGTVSSWYLEESKTLTGYDYDSKGLPVIVVQANAAEWDSCKALAESVLTTLRVP